MSITTTMRKQSAVYWAANGVDRYGVISFDDGIVIACRWQDEIRQFVKADGTTKLSMSVVFPDRITAPGSRLRLGDATGVDLTDHTANENVFEVQALKQIPNIGNTETLYTAFL